MSVKKLFQIIFYGLCLVLIAATAYSKLDESPFIKIGSMLSGEPSEEGPIAYHERRMAETDGPGWTDLHRAAAKGDVAEVQRLLQSGADIGAREAKQGASALYEAARRGHVQVMEVLIQNGADVNVQTNALWTPMAVASEYKQAGAIRVLLKHGADVNLPDDDGNTPLHQAAFRYWHGDAEIAQILVEEGGAEIDVSSHSGCQPVFCATSKGHLPVVKYLLSKGADPNFQTPNGTQVLYKAVSNQYFEITQALLDAGANPNVIYNNAATPLMKAVMDQNEQLTKLLLDHKADPNLIPEDNGYPLMEAVVPNNKRIAHMLLEHGADPNGKPSDTYDTPLYYAIKGHEDAELVRILLEAGADPNRISGSDSIPLFTAVRLGDIEMVRPLLEHGADPMMKASNGKTIQDFAAWLGRKEILDLMFQERLKRLEDRKKKKS